MQDLSQQGLKIRRRLNSGDQRRHPLLRSQYPRFCGLVPLECTLATPVLKPTCLSTEVVVFSEPSAKVPIEQTEVARRKKICPRAGGVLDRIPKRKSPDSIEDFLLVGRSRSGLTLTSLGTGWFLLPTGPLRMSSHRTPLTTFPKSARARVPRP
jgi:hypothetical protein